MTSSEFLRHHPESLCNSILIATIDAPPAYVQAAINAAGSKLPTNLPYPAYYSR